MPQVNGHESKPLWVSVGLLYNFTNVKMKGPYKPLEMKKCAVKECLWRNLWIAPYYNQTKKFVLAGKMLKTKFDANQRWNIRGIKFDLD